MENDEIIDGGDAGDLSSHTGLANPTNQSFPPKPPLPSVIQPLHTRPQEQPRQHNRSPQQKNVARKRNQQQDAEVAFATPPPAKTPHPQPPSLRTKRPRILGSGLHLEPTDAPPGNMLGARKRFKPPSTYVGRPAKNGKVCCFCGVAGHQRECEGKLLGPFHVPGTGKKVYAHRNCAVWAPEVWEPPKNGLLQGVPQALARAKKAKCCLCGGTGASLSCMYKRAACCRPMHFRCALRGGASLRDNFQTFCPNHSNCSANGVGPPPTMEHYLERTPIDNELISPGSGCTMCNGDSYNTHLGTILTCSSCLTRHHSKCMWPDMERDGSFSAMSWQGKYLCKKCMTCVTCQRPIDKEVYADKEKVAFLTGHEAFDIPESDGPDPECDTVKCLGCKHFASHKACLPEGSAPESWRCDHCLLCKHCGAVDVPRDEWDERAEACLVCYNELRRGGVVCPVCLKVYREGENIPMVQCDYCDKWLHALGCGGLTVEKFAELEQSAADVKYRCPICAKQKKARELERRRSKLGSAAFRTNGFGVGRSLRVADPELILKQVDHEAREVAFQFVRKAATQGDNFESVFMHLSPDVEICLRCCSRGDEGTMFSCIDCGDCFHHYCYDPGAACPLPSHAKAQGAATKERTPSRRSSLNGSSPDGKAWRCLECASLKRMTKSPKLAVENGKYAQAPIRNGDAMQDDREVGVVMNGNGFTHHGGSSQGDSDASLIIVEDSSVTWKDKRVCELCGYGEDPNKKEGRLIPWASITSADVSHCWVHVGCLLWSYGVSLHGPEKGLDVVLAPRRSLLNFAKNNVCGACGGTGATLRCSSAGCEKTYHFRCSLSMDVGCELQFANDHMARSLVGSIERASGSVTIASIESLRFMCPAHRAVSREGNDKVLSLAEAQGLLNLDRRVKVFDTQGFSPEAEPPTKKPLSPDRLLSIRVGSLSVLQFGRLVPEVNDFIVNGWLIPLGYCATRRFWSLVNATKRCLYYFEVCGYPQSGPLFVIRCSDCVNERFVSKDPEAAWAMVKDRIKAVREKAGWSDDSYVSFHITGLQAFGLANCIPVVTHVESLPMASMFAGRYSLKRVATHRSDEVVFYNSLAKKFVPAEIRKNISGSARTEGYSSSKWRKKMHDDRLDIPSYENARTGAAFQLHVAREVFSKSEYVHPQIGVDDHGKLDRRRLRLSKATTFTEDRSRANKATTSLPFASQHRCVAATSKTRTVILRSNIDGCGVFATKDIPAGEMIIEYVGEIIRPVLSDIRESRYLEDGIGCYMFQIEPGLIVDATMCGNAARYINHSCEPNCYSKTVALENDRKVVAIFAKRHIQRGEELSYDYQFPLDDADRVKCGCGTERCKGWMN